MKDRLRQLREALKLKQRNIAEKLGVDVSVVGKWETGRQSIPAPRVYQICKEYGVRREWFETGDGEMFEPGEAPVKKEDALRAVALALFNELSKEGQEAVIAAVDEFLEKSGKTSKRKGSKTQTNNGTVHGDMVQN